MSHGDALQISETSNVSVLPYPYSSCNFSGTNQDLFVTGLPLAESIGEIMSGPALKMIVARLIGPDPSQEPWQRRTFYLLL
ncbi:hypothetical protein KDA_76490 [Dictyobacter alpinus]|uniref:Uncharacterized protein n=1 Tax=Dictyobacter alpinus TaxID=2014873 RepID=A0A402BLB6_9CHLR|nr:hypothetical protein KDA_76490 [Dictyobacter alpinus]